MKLDQEALKKAEMAVVEASICGLTIEGERSFCDDPRAHDRASRCDCRISANAAVSAYLSALPAEGVVVPEGWKLVPENLTPEMLQAGTTWSGLQVAWARMLAASPKSPVSGNGWRTDMENAPKDGTDFLAWPCHFKDGPAPVKARWYRHPSVSGWITDELDCGDYDFTPTHWMPLPAPPSTEVLP